MTFSAEAQVRYSHKPLVPFPVVCQAVHRRGENQISRQLAQRVALLSPESFDNFFNDDGCALFLDVFFKGHSLRVSSFGTSPQSVGATDFPEGIDILIDSHELSQLRHELRLAVREGTPMICKPVFRYRPSHRSAPGHQCFVIMPFSESWSDRIWSRHLRPTIEDAGFECRRADELFAPGVIVEDIWREIVDCDVVVADLTGRNSNVFYELGLAHVVGTPVILLTQDSGSFDVAHWRQIRYSDNSDGYDKLHAGLKAALSTFKDRIDIR